MRSVWSLYKEPVNLRWRRGRYNITKSNCLQENLKEIEKLVAGPRQAPDTKIDRR
jgi:hypothetical protein